MGDTAEFWDSASFHDLWAAGSFPCSFIYGGREAEDILPHWKKVEKITKHKGFTETIITFTDPQTQLICTIELRTYADFPAFDWVMKFKNSGSQPTPILEDILPLSGVWQTHSPVPTEIFYNKGSDCKVDDFLPQTAKLKHWEAFELKGVQGRPSVTALPFMRMVNGNQSCIIAIGWTGQWIQRFILNQQNKAEQGMVMLEGGMEKTHFKLLPGEEVRTPRILLLFGDADKFKIHNQFRRLILTYYSPIVNGARAQVPLCYPTWGGVPITEHLDRVATIKRHTLKFDYYWVDAGWFIDESEKKTSEAAGTWAKWAGKWSHSTTLYPNGLKPLSDAIHNAGMKFLLWVEPERARKYTETPMKHPNFYLHRKTPTDDLCFHLGNPEARKWLIDFISDLIRNYGVDCYRQDFNFDPLPYWEAADEAAGSDRQGITEIYHVMGLYEFWDTLLARFPGLLIDDCASGGRRIDIEMIRRAIPLWRSDLQCFQDFDPTGSQIHTYGLMMWAPLSSTGTCYHPGDTYYVRSGLSSGLVLHHILDWYGEMGKEINPLTKSGYLPQMIPYDEKTYPWDWYTKMIEEFRKVQPFMEADYYPLATVSESPTDWCVMQYHSNEKNAGIVLGFRREASPFVQAEYPLHDLNNGTVYRFTNADTKDTTDIESSILSSKGLLLTIPNRRSSVLLFYDAIQPIP